MSSTQLQTVIQQAQQLSSAEQVELINRLLDNLTQQQAASAREPRYLIYGEFRDSGVGRMSTEEDFKLAEWNPTDEELDEY